MGKWNDDKREWLHGDEDYFPEDLQEPDLELGEES